MMLLVALALSIPLGLDLYLPVPEDNPLSASKVELGRKLFHDARLSRSGTVACASCHDPARAFSDSRPLAVGVFGRTGRRHAPALINRAYGLSFFWDGRTVTLEAQVLEPIQNPDEMDLSLGEAAARVGLPIPVISQALASYIRTILAADSPYDRFVRGDQSALSQDEQRGLRLFRGRGNCTACHAGPTLTDERFHNTGVAWQRHMLRDPGRGNGTFKTPTLREVARTAPYMHDGSLATLADVVNFYSDGGRSNPYIDPEIRPVHFTGDEKHSLVMFLESLCGTVVDGIR
jgi:cytochrome c peroxidase